MHRYVATALVIVTLCTISAQAWWCTGHMTIAEIAKRNLESGVESQVETAISNLASMGPFPKAPDMVQAACWADDIKSNQFAMAGWHFLNQVYDPTGYPFANPIQKINVETAIPLMEDGIKKYPNNWELSFAVANMIHFFGDIHQPLHVTEMFSSTFPNGDYGGNLFMVNLNGTSIRLHSVWDSLCGNYQTEWERPLSAEHYTQIRSLATSFSNAYSPSSSEKDVWNTTIIAQEGYNDAVTYAYANLTPGESLSTSYLDTCWNIVTKRLVLGGLRLANELNYAFGSHHDRLSSTQKADLLHQRLKEIKTSGKKIN